METNRQRAEELLCKKSKISIGCLVADYKQKCITPEIAIDAMLAFRNEAILSLRIRRRNGFPDRKCTEATEWNRRDFSPLRCK